MSVVGKKRRAAVERRAGFRCEYCHLLMRGQVAQFEIDHAIPRSAGGKTEPNNLVLACPRCNTWKAAEIAAADPETGDTIPLFNPRSQDWDDHFAWSESDPVLLEGKTPCGRATI